MSVIFGLFYRDGKPVEGEPEEMYAGMRHFPHESHAFAVHGNCGFGHMLTYNTPEAVRESMPKWLEDERLLFTAEGRLDNRGELLDALNVHAAERGNMPDGDILLAAYLKWGEACVDRCLGKWSFAAFHTEDQRLFLARDRWDYTGVAYYGDSRVFAFSTSEKGLLPLAFISKTIDELMVARMLIAWPGDYDRSFHPGIRYLMPSHALLVTRGREQLRRYWRYDTVPVRRGLKPEDYTGELLERLNEAVAARLRTYKPVAATMSGGLDSSTVCALAAEQLKRQGKRLRTYTHVPRFAPSNTLGETQFGDERPFAEAVAEAAGNIDPMFLTSAELSPLEGIREAVRMCGRPFHGAVNAYWIVDIYQTAVREGYGTLLLGEFGNATTSWAGMADALSAAETLRRYGAVKLVKRKLLKPLLYGHTPVAAAYKRLRFGPAPWKQISYCTQSFADSLNLGERVRKSGFDTTFKYYFANPKDQAVKILDANVLRLSFGADFACETGLELRDPTGDPRVIECALAIPNEMFLGDMNRWVLRTMMRGRLPDSVRLNAGKGKQSSDSPARLYEHREEMEAALREMEAAGFGRIVDMAKLRAQWEALKADPGGFSPDTAAHMLRPAAAFELYRQSNGNGRPGGSNN